MIVPYHVTFRASVEKSLEKLPQSAQTRLIAKAIGLTDDPRPHGSVRLAGVADHDLDLWRVRVGDYRLVYAIDDVARVVDIRIVVHRRDVYRGL